MIPFNFSDFMASGAFVCGTRQLAGKTNLSKILVSNLLERGVICHILDASKAWLELSHLMKVTEYPYGFGYLDIDFSVSQVHDISQLGYRNRVTVANQICKNIYESRVQSSRATHQGVPTVVVFEEAQGFLPNGCMRNLDTYGPIVDFITVGGNYNLSFLAITQFAAAVDKAIVKAAGQRYFGQTTERNDVGYVRNFIGDPESAQLRQQIGHPAENKKDKKFITYFLQRGQFVYQHMGKVSVFQSPKYEAPEPVAPQHSGQGYSFDFQPFTAQF